MNMSAFNMSPLKIKCIFWVSLLFIWASIIVGALWSKGYQQQVRRYVTNEEIIKIAISQVLRTMERESSNANFISGQTDFYKSGSIVLYRDVEHFLEENPNCCVLRKKFTGIYVDVSGKIIYRDQFGQTRFSEPIELLINNNYFPESMYYMP